VWSSECSSVDSLPSGRSLAFLAGQYILVWAGRAAGGWRCDRSLSLLCSYSKGSRIAVVWRTKVSLSTRRPVGESEFLTLLDLLLSASGLTAYFWVPLYTRVCAMMLCQSVGLCVCAEIDMRSDERSVRTTEMQWNNIRTNWDSCVTINRSKEVQSECLLSFFPAHITAETNKRCYKSKK